MVVKVQSFEPPCHSSVHTISHHAWYRITSRITIFRVWPSIFKPCSILSDPCLLSLSTIFDLPNDQDTSVKHRSSPFFGAFLVVRLSISADTMECFADKFAPGLSRLAGLVPELSLGISVDRKLSKSVPRSREPAARTRAFGPSRSRELADESGVLDWFPWVETWATWDSWAVFWGRSGGGFWRAHEEVPRCHHLEVSSLRTLKHKDPG